MMHHILYKTVRPSTGEYYYGIHSTKNLLDGYQGSGEKLKRKMKSGDLFITGIVDVYETREELELAERQLVDGIMLTDPLCLNIAYGGGSSMYQRSHSDTTKAKMSISRKQRVTTNETRTRMSKNHKGKKMPPRSDEARAKRSDGEYIIDGVSYVSSNVAGRALGCDGATIRNRCKNTKNKKFQNYIFLPKQTRKE